MGGKQAWYLSCSEEQIAERVILLGDPGRVPRFSKHLSNVEHLPANRGLITVTGTYKGCRLTLSAFGMGAPIAAIVLHELSDLGANVFLRIGTSIGVAPVEIGNLVVAKDALSFEGTSAAYAATDAKPVADTDLMAALISAANAHATNHHVGTFASFDGFYRDMFALDGATERRVRENFKRLGREGVIAVDMETSAILTVGNTLGCKVGSLCASTVDSLTKKKISESQHRDVEAALIAVALDTITSMNPL